MPPFANEYWSRTRRGFTVFEREIRARCPGADPVASLLSPVGFGSLERHGQISHRPVGQRREIEAALEQLEDRRRIEVLVSDAGFVEAPGNQQRRNAGARPPLIGGLRLVAPAMMRRR